MWLAILVDLNWFKSFELQIILVKDLMKVFAARGKINSILTHTFLFKILVSLVVLFIDSIAR